MKIPTTIGVYHNLKGGDNMTYDVRSLHTVKECSDAIFGYELEKKYREDFAPAVAAYDNAIFSLKARIDELSGKKVTWVTN